MKAAGYVRVSTEEQAREGVSLAAQRERIAAYCRMQGLDLAEVFCDNGVSGGRPLATREGGAALLEVLARGRIGHVVTLKLDRLFRDTVDCLQTARAWDRAGVSLHLIDMGGQAINTGNAMGRFFLTMAAGFAEMERNLTAERTAAALAHKKGRRQIYGPTPYGYRVTEHGELVEDPGEQQTVARLLAWRRAGVSYARIAARLNAEEIPTKQGRRWYASTVRYIAMNSLYREAA